MSRFVDADALKKAFLKPLNDFVAGANNSLEIGGIIDAQPTADVREVVHGEWIYYEKMLTCNKCGAEYYDDIIEYCGDDVPKHCPNCGARMDGGK